MSDRESFQYLFGPVASRRFGRSLGVDLLGKRICSFNCIFCEAGPTRFCTLQRDAYVPVGDVIREIQAWIDAGGSTDVITLAGLGEPTLHLHFGVVIDAVHARTDFPVVLLSNGSLMHLAEVREAAARADIVKISLGVWDDASLASLNQPAEGLSFQDYFAGLVQFRSDYKGELRVEVMFVKGVNDSMDAAKRIAEHVAMIQADKVEINTVVRPPADRASVAVPLEDLELFAAFFGPHTSVIGVTKAKAATDCKGGNRKNRDVSREILSLLQRRGCTLQDIAVGIGLSEKEIYTLLDQMIQKKLVMKDDGENPHYRRGGIMSDVISMENGVLQVPDHPVIPFIEGDGVGAEIMTVARKVLDAAVKQAYSAERSLEWLEVYAGEKSVKRNGEGVWLPDETLDMIRKYLVAIKGPLMTPIGGGIRSLNVALRQGLDLYVCQRPVRWFEGVPSPVRHPERTNMVVFRENSEDIYAGIEWKMGSAEVKKVIRFLQEEMGVEKIRFPETSGIGIKPVSQEGTQRLVMSAIRYAIQNDKPSVTLVHKGNIMKFTEGGFRDWGYETAIQYFGAQKVGNGPQCVLKNPLNGKEIVIKDVIADAFLEHLLTRPAEYSVIATLNLNGDYISDAAAACVGGIGISPGANINYDTGTAVFEATHGTAPDLTGKDKANPGSLILSGEMMLRYLGWTEAADLLVEAMNQTIKEGLVTFDFARMMPETTELSCSAFGEQVYQHMAGSAEKK